MERPELLCDTQHKSIKNVMFYAIKAGDLEKVRKMMYLFEIEVREEISTRGMYWTSIHYAVFFNDHRILDFLL